MSYEEFVSDKSAALIFGIEQGESELKIIHLQLAIFYVISFISF